MNSLHILVRCQTTLALALTGLTLCFASQQAAAQADLAVSQSESIEPVTAGSGVSNLVYVVSVTNQSLIDATGVTVSYEAGLPIDVAIEAIVPSAGSFANGLWNLGNLNAGTGETLTVYLTVPSTAAPGLDSVRSIARITGAAGGLINPGDDSSTNTTTVVTDFITGIAFGGIRNNFSGHLGMQITIGPRPIVVTHLGRIVATNNTRIHTLKIVDAASALDVPGTTVMVNVAGGPFLEFVYAPFPTPVLLASNTTYFVVSTETNVADIWYDNNTRVTNAGVASVDGAVFEGSGFDYTLAQNNTNFTYGPVDFKYAPLNSPPTAVDDLVAGLQDTMVCLYVTNILSNDTDPNGDVLTITALQTSSTMGGTVTLSSNLISYIPPPGFTNDDTFDYHISDGRGGVDTGTITVAVRTPQIDGAGLPLTTNLQTGLYEQVIQVSNQLTNAGCGTIGAVRILIGGLPNGAVVANAHGMTGGMWFVDLNQPLDPGAIVELVLEYFLTDRVNLPTPTIVTMVIPPGTPPNDPGGTPLLLDPPRLLANGRFLIEFASIPGETYALQYSGTNTPTTWITVEPFIQAVANRTQWIDDGPPKTESKPTDVSSRMYQVIQLQAP